MGLVQLVLELWSQFATSSFPSKEGKIRMWSVWVVYNTKPYIFCVPPLKILGILQFEIIANCLRCKVTCLKSHTTGGNWAGLWIQVYLTLETLWIPLHYDMVFLKLPWSGVKWMLIFFLKWMLFENLILDPTADLMSHNLLEMSTGIHSR